MHENFKKCARLYNKFVIILFKVKYIFLKCIFILKLSFNILIKYVINKFNIYESNDIKYQTFHGLLSTREWAEYFEYTKPIRHEMCKYK